MKTALSDIRQEVENLSSIQVNYLTFNIAYFLGGDWKFLALVTGKLMRESESVLVLQEGREAREFWCIVH